MITLPLASLFTDLQTVIPLYRLRATQNEFCRIASLPLIYVFMYIYVLYVKPENGDQIVINIMS